MHLSVRQDGPRQRGWFPADSEFRARGDRWVRRRGSEPGSALTAGVAGVRRGVGVAVGGQMRGCRRRGWGWGSEPRGRKLKVGGRGAGKVRDVGSGAWLRARSWALWFGVTALRSLPYPDLGPAPCLWDPQAPLALGRTPGLPGHFHNPPPHLHQLLNLGSQIRSDTLSTQASPFQTLTPGSTTHGHPLPLKPFPVGGLLSLVSFIFSDLAFLTLRTSVSLGAILMGCLSVRGLV